MRNIDGYSLMYLDVNMGENDWRRGVPYPDVWLPGCLADGCSTTIGQMVCPRPGKVVDSYLGGWHLYPSFYTIEGSIGVFVGLDQVYD